MKIKKKKNRSLNSRVDPDENWKPLRVKECSNYCTIALNYKLVK